MVSLTHLIHSVAVEDDQIHLGQLVDTTRDSGIDSGSGTGIRAYLINGDIFGGQVTQVVYTVKKVCARIPDALTWTASSSGSRCYRGHLPPAKE